jgi:mannosyltransferase
MQQKPILIHTHFHKRRTGVTRSIENVWPFFEEDFDIYIYGYGVEGRKISFFQVLKWVVNRQYFVMHCHRNNEIMQALFFKLLGGNFKLISTRHAETKPSSFTKFLLKKSDVVVALTQKMANDLPFVSKVVGHGVDIYKFKPDNDVKLSFIKQKNIITCAGRVRKAKGQKVLVKAIAPILKQFPDWALVIVGKVDKPEFLQELKTIVHQHDVTNQIYFLKQTSAIIDIYQASHTVVVPSFTEGFSLVCAEAMACGCNIIATKDVGIHSELIKNEHNGYLVEAGNVDELQELLNAVMCNKKAHLGKEAQLEISTKWSALQEAQKLMEIYKNH